MGFRGHATTIGLVRLSAELHRAGVLSDDALSRVKDAIASDLTLGGPHFIAPEEFMQSVRKQLDTLFDADEGLT